MEKDTPYFGIDISKDFFDVMSQKGVHYQFKNTPKGFRDFLKILLKSEAQFFKKKNLTFI